MASFFEKLKRGMDIEEPIAEPEKEIEEKPIETKTGKEPKKLKTELPKEAKVEKRMKFSSTAKKEKESPEVKIRKLETQTKMPEEEREEEREEEEVKEQAEKEPPKELKEQKEKKWPSFGKIEEGQLAIDVYQTENDLVIQSAIAGVKPENLDISIERDIITIKGSREKPFEENGDYFIQECFWGPFSREVILPSEVDPQRAVAEMKNNILTIRIPKILREKKRRIIVRE
ncbi:MAG: Hsp20/alpha crystallin family protein [Candidatus Nealsonbacteria bacterium]|nr:Hsp20/alpha crystallin family protein [Candidatus Nealsonbacteria bacterium]